MSVLRAAIAVAFTAVYAFSVVFAVVTDSDHGLGIVTVTTPVVALCLSFLLGVPIGKKIRESIRNGNGNGNGGA